VDGRLLLGCLLVAAALSNCSISERAARDDVAKDTRDIRPKVTEISASVSTPEPGPENSEPNRAPPEIASLYKEVENHFLVMPDIESEARKLIRKSHANWLQRFDGCRDPKCRDKLRQEELNRLNFALGRKSGPIAGVPFKTGRFGMEWDKQFEGEAAFLPLGDGLVLAHISSINSEKGSTCDFTGYGPLPLRGKTRLTESDPQGSDEAAQIELVLLSDRRLSVDGIGDGKLFQYCGLGAYLTGSYLAD
jgi:hypothetical protein